MKNTIEYSNQIMEMAKLHGSVTLGNNLFIVSELLFNHIEEVECEKLYLVDTLFCEIDELSPDMLITEDLSNIDVGLNYISAYCLDFADAMYQKMLNGEEFDYSEFEAVNEYFYGEE